MYSSTLSLTSALDGGGEVVNATPRAALPWYRDPVPIVQNAGWAPESVWTGAEKIATTGIRSLDSPVRKRAAIPSYHGSQTNSLRVTIGLLDENGTCGHTCKYVLLWEGDCNDDFDAVCTVHRNQLYKQTS